jgi:hypothetical protein
MPTPSKRRIPAAMLASLPPERLEAETPEPKSWARLFEDFMADQFAETPEERAEREARGEGIRAKRDAVFAERRRGAQRRAIEEMLAEREDAVAHGEEPPDFPKPPVAVLGPSLRPILPEPGER